MLTTSQRSRHHCIAEKGLLCRLVVGERDLFYFSILVFPVHIFFFVFPFNLYGAQLAVPRPPALVLWGRPRLWSRKLVHQFHLPSTNLQKHQRIMQKRIFTKLLQSNNFRWTFLSQRCHCLEITASRLSCFHPGSKRFWTFEQVHFFNLTLNIFSLFLMCFFPGLTLGRWSFQPLPTQDYGQLATSGGC